MNTLYSKHVERQINAIRIAGYHFERKTMNGFFAA
jgi:hypothetical protein